MNSLVTYNALRKGVLYLKSIIPYTKEIEFDSKLAEICSISLEHELNITDTDIEGNFIVSGEYKSHEISINKETFLYKLPFSVEVTDNIKKDSIEFEITDFTYEIVGDSTLKVNIEFSVSALEEEKETSREAIVEEVEELLEEELKPTEAIDENESLEERIDKESADLILDSASHKEDEFTTYFIHQVKSGDTLESIINTYQTDLATIKKYNSFEELNVGDKIIIPSIDE